MVALLMDDRISSAEKILTYNPSTKCMEPTRSVKSLYLYKKCAIRTAYKLHRLILRTFICYQASSWLSSQRCGHLAAACLAKLEQCSIMQWPSSYAAVSYQNPELRIKETKMCKLWRGTFCKQQSM